LKKYSFLFLVLLTSLSVRDGFCLSYEDIKKYAEEKYLDPMAKDVGGVLGGGYYHYAKNLGLPGFDIGIRVPVKNISDDDIVLKSTDSKNTIILLPLVQVEIGLPMNFDLIVRGISFEKISVFGGAIRYTFFSSKTLLDFSISGIIGYGSLSHDYMKANTTSANVIASIGIPIVKPYIGFGYDTSTLIAGDKAKNENPALADLKGEYSGTRFEIGANISPFPFVYLYGAYNYIYGDTGYTFGLGVKF